MTADVPLDVIADLTLQVTGSSGDLQASISGDGDRVTVTTDDPLALLGALRGAVLPPGVPAPASRQVLREVADRLDRAGLAVDVDGGSGRLLTIGHGVDSALGRVFAGERRVGPGDRGALLRLARGSLSTRRLGLAVVTLGAVAAIVRRTRR